MYHQPFHMSSITARYYQACSSALTVYHLKKVRDSNQKVTGFSGIRRQFAVARVVTTPDQVRYYVTPGYSKF